MALLFTATFRGKYAASSEELHRTKLLCGCQKATDVDCPDTGNGPQPAVLYRLFNKNLWRQIIRQRKGKAFMKKILL